MRFTKEQIESMLSDAKRLAAVHPLLGRDVACHVMALACEVESLYDLIGQLADSEECRYDHHGKCQEHWLHEKPCPHGVAPATSPDLKLQRVVEPGAEAKWSCEFGAFRRCGKTPWEAMARLGSAIEEFRRGG